MSHVSRIGFAARVLVPFLAGCQLTPPEFPTAKPGVDLRGQLKDASDYCRSAGTYARKCMLRGIAITDYAACRSPLSPHRDHRLRDVDHPLRGMPITDFASSIARFAARDHY